MPSNILLKKLRPSVFLSSIIAIWGVITIGMGCVGSFAGLVVCRLLIGFFEAGFFPGCLYLISMCKTTPIETVLQALFPRLSYLTLLQTTRDTSFSGVSTYSFVHQSLQAPSAAYLLTQLHIWMASLGTADGGTFTMLKTSLILIHKKMDLHPRRSRHSCRRCYFVFHYPRLATHREVPHK